MFDACSRLCLVLGAWLVAAVTIVAASLTFGASASTSVLVLTMCAAPLVVALLLGFATAPSVTLGDGLHGSGPQGHAD